jgi:hypothetical protein
MLSKFSMVCKSWKDAVETIKFNREVPLTILDVIDHIITSRLSISPYFEKYLQCFRKLHAPMNLFSSENGHQMISLVLKNMQKLNYIHFGSDLGSLPDTVDPFMLQILENSHETLQYTSISRFCIPDICFPKLNALTIEIGQDICLPEFKTYFPQMLKNMERLETVELFVLEPAYHDIYEYVANNYEKHCIRGSANSTRLLNIVPVKILIGVSDLERDLQNMKCVSGIQYLHVWIYNTETPMRCGWDKYQEIFDQCLNLKAIELSWMRNYEFGAFVQVSAANQNIWQERMSYFKTRGIRIADDRKIFLNANLETKLAKEASVTWKFCFC